MLMEIIEELGSDRGLEMLQSAVKKQADIIARELRRKLPEGLSRLDLGAEIYRHFMSDAGAEVLVHEKGKSSVTFRVSRCPFYEALLDVGVDCGYLQSGLCVNLIHPAFQAILTRFDPGLRLESKLVRQGAEEFCLERIYVADD